jgi:RNA polymerase sigma factor (sigma-70 family)
VTASAALDQASAIRAKIAVVDDDRSYLRCVTRAVSRNAALEVHAMSDEDAVARRWDASEFDLVVLDVFMPRTSGIQLCRTVRAHDRETTIVVMSGAMTDEIARDARSAGATLAVDKPDDPQAFVALTERLVGVRTAADETARRVRAHVGLARNIARRLARRYDMLLDRGDIEGYAMLGLCEAARRFDHRRGEAFVAFAARRIRGAVLDQLRRMAAHDRSVDNGRLAASDIPVQRVEHRDSIARMCSALRQLAPIEIAVLSLRYDEELALGEIAARLALTRPRVAQLHRRGLARLRAALVLRERTRS